MKATNDEIRALVKDKKITGISLDTSAFDRQRRGLERGLLRRLQQFADSDIQLVLSDVVLKELRAHMVEDAVEAHADLKKTLKKLEGSCQVAHTATEKISAELLVAGAPEDVAGKRIEAFLDVTDGIVLEAKDANPLEEVLARYFDIKPPFGRKESKRHEFPDAIALLTLNNWAKTKGTMLLVVTHDNDWKAYIEQSESLVAIDDLAEALGMFQDEAANYFCQEILVGIREGDPKGIVGVVKDAVEDQQSKIDVEVVADSQFSVDAEYSEVELEFVGIQHLEEDSALEAIEYDKNTLVARLHVDVVAHVTTHFSFAKWDSIDKEYIPMGSTEVEHDREATLEVLVTFSGQLPGNPAIDNVELVPETINAEFYDLEPAWMREREEEEL